jgi:predicted TIM-barrel fold metal-dependent hydrolase
MCLRAYNDWMIEDWAGGAPGRFIPLVIVPLWDAALAAEEVHRTAARGAKAVAFSENPAKLGLPSVHDRGGFWDPFLAAIDETSMPLCIHFGSSSMVPNTSDDAPIYVSALLSPLNLAYATADWLFSPHLARYPNLKICLSEGGIGWIPYILERADYIIETMRWAERFEPSTPAGEAQPVRSFEVGPAELFRQHIYGCFINDEFGLENLSRIGVDNVMIETDYPHGDGTFPSSLDNAQRLLSRCTPEDRYKIMQGNARRVFNLNDLST